jgi:putative ABC transport system permease protein
MDSLLHDLRYSVRQLLKHKAFTIVAVLTLALGIGANTAVFSVVYGVLMRPLPYPDPDRIVGLAESGKGFHDQMGVTYHEFQYIAEHAPVFQSFAAFTLVGMNLNAGAAADHLRALRVSSDYFRVLGVAPQLGREFTAEEDRPDGASVIILSHGLWQRRFGGDRGIVGRSVLVDGVATTVVGVMPAGYQSLPAADAWSTLAQVGRTVGSGENLGVIARLPRTTSLIQANSRTALPFADFRHEFKQMGLPEDLQMSLVPYTQLMVSDIQAPVILLFGAIAFVLLIACANVASLLLGRAALRNRELAVRVALGATRRRIIRQLLTESILLAILGGAAAVLVADWGLQALLSFVPHELPRTAEVHLDRWALLFTFAIALLTGLGFGLVPAWLAVRADPHGALKEASSRTTGSAGQARLRNILVIGEIALALVLLTGAGLMIRTFSNLVRADAGFDVGHVVSAEIWLTGSRYDTPTATAGYYRELTGRLRALPGVTSAAVVEAGLPLERGGNISMWEGSRRLEGGIDYRTVTPGYFPTLGVPLREGRDFTDADDATGAPVVVVSQAFARQYFPAGALGRALIVGGNDSVQRTIVGVAGDVKSHIAFHAPPIVFLPSAQTRSQLTRIFNGWFPIHVLVRTDRDPALHVAALARAIAATDPAIPVGQVRAMSEVLGESVALERFVMILLSVFAGLAITLAMVGIYGLISWFVAQSTRDIGVRIALGALPGNIMALVVGRGMRLAVLGGGIGVVGAVALTRLLSDLLFDVKPVDPLILAGTAVLLGLVAAVACYLPARRAARLDPIISLRSE